MSIWFHPAFIFILGSIVVPFLHGNSERLRKILKVYVLVLPSIAFASLLLLPKGTYWSFELFGHQMVLGRVDKLSLVFAYVFVMLHFIGMLFSLHTRWRWEHFAAFLYAGATLGLVFAGDFMTLYFFWELMAVSSTVIIWGGRNSRSWQAGIRFIAVHLFSGLCLLVGFIFHYYTTGSLEFVPFTESSLAFYLVLMAALVNAAVPPFSAWLSDAYPESTPTGTVFLSGFTSKSAVYVLARAFPGTELLVWMGVAMAIYGVVYAVLENDIRRLLAYHIISQVGYMVAGVGIGTELAINGLCAHAFSHIMYKALLFMGAGAVIQMAGKRKLTELGGIYKYMPLTFFLYMVGGFSISAFPLFNGFISKSMVVAAAAEDHRFAIWAMLTFASCGTFLHTGLKLPYFIFFGKDSGLRPKEPPINMLIAMGMTAFLCIFFGVCPTLLYGLLPYHVDYKPYTSSHVVGSLQMLMFTALMFFLLIKKAESKQTITLDTDWIYRKAIGLLFWVIDTKLFYLVDAVKQAFFTHIPAFLVWFGENPSAALRIAGNILILPFVGAGKEDVKKTLKYQLEGYPGLVVKPLPVGYTVIIVGFLLLAILVIYIFAK